MQSVDEYENITSNFIHTAHFGVRFGAFILDTLILWVVSTVINFVIGIGMAGFTGTFLMHIFSFALAFGRILASILSGIILCIGYLMIVFDKKYVQGLYDKICKIRVLNVD